VKSTAVTVAVVVLLAMAAIGLASGVPPWIASVRALVGAAVAYALVLIAGRVAVRVLVDLLRHRPQPGGAATERPPRPFEEPRR